MSDREDMELAPCPFCGGEAHFNKVEYSDRMVKEQEWDQSVFHGVNCIVCGVSNIGLVGHKNQQKAASAWNTRSAVRTGPDVAVKPLEWREKNSDGSVHMARTILGPYYALQIDGTGYWSNDASIVGIKVSGDMTNAKAAAQADYEQRIRSAITAVGTAEPGYVAGFEATEAMITACAQAMADADTSDGPPYVTLARAGLRAAIAALPAPATATASADWRTMDSAPKDGRAIAVICWWPSYTDDKPGKWSNPETYRYEQDPQREQCWIDVHRSSCIREERWIERYRWAPLPTDLPPAPTITRKSEERS